MVHTKTSHLHYRIHALCRVPKTPGKDYFALGKAFIGYSTRQRAVGAKSQLAKISLSGTFYRAPSKDFAECKPGTRQRKVAVTASGGARQFLRLGPLRNHVYYQSTTPDQNTVCTESKY
jgi:hypothetical protein